MQSTELEIDRTTAKLGPIWLEQGVSRSHCFSLYLGSLFTIGILTVVSVGTNWVLIKNLNIPFGERGTIVGNLAFWTEITQIALFALIGVAADKIGRRPIYVAGLLTFGLAYALYPFAQNLGQLTIYRVIYAAGLAMSTGMLATVSADYPQNGSRGKLVAIVGVLNGLGVVLLNTLFGYLPAMFSDAGVDPVWAGRYAHFVIVGICIVVAIILHFGLKPGAPMKEPSQFSAGVLLRSGIREGRNPRIALAYFSAFVARSDMVILGTFVVTWGVGAGEAMGLSDADAIKQATIIFVITQSSALVFAPFIGMLMDRINRISGLAICMLIAAIGYSLPIYIDNPLDKSAIPIFIMMGLGQISAFLGATILIGQEAPVKERGSVIGMFNMMGAVGILIAASWGGRLFDAVGPWAPFMLIAVGNILIFIFALIVRWTSPGFVPAGEAALLRRLGGNSQADAA